LRVTEADRMMTVKPNVSSSNIIPDSSGSPPSIWNENWKEYSCKLAEEIILTWRDELALRNKEFVILYIPRGREFLKESSEQDSWKSWLETFCKKQDIRIGGIK